MPTRPAWLALAVLVLAGCRPEVEPPTTGPFAGTRLTVSMSLAEEEQEAIHTLLRRFERETGARVTLVAVAGQDLPEKLRVEVGAGRPTLDLFAQDNLTLRALVDGKLVEDLSDVALPEGVVAAMVPPPLDGRRYFLPFRPNVQVTYVNRERFQRAGVAPPRTVEELRQVARALKAAAGTPKITLSLDQGAGTAVTISEWVVGFGGDPLVLNDAGSVAAFEFLQGLWREELLAKESLLAKFDTQVDYLQGETAWLAANWPFTSMVFAEQDILDRFRVYEGWRGPARAAHVIGGDVLGIPRGVPPPRRRAAVELARFLMGPDAQRLLAERNAWPSIRTDVYGEVPPALRETFAAIERALRDGFFRPHVPYWPEVTDAMNEAVRRVIERGEPAKMVLDALHVRIAEAARRKGAPYPPRSSASAERRRVLSWARDGEPRS